MYDLAEKTSPPSSWARDVAGDPHRRVLLPGRRVADDMHIFAAGDPLVTFIGGSEAAADRVCWLILPSTAPTSRRRRAVRSRAREKRSGVARDRPIAVCHLRAELPCPAGLRLEDRRGTARRAPSARALEGPLAGAPSPLDTLAVRTDAGADRGTRAARAHLRARVRGDPRRQDPSSAPSERAPLDTDARARPRAFVRGEEFPCSAGPRGISNRGWRPAPRGHHVVASPRGMLVVAPVRDRDRHALRPREVVELCAARLTRRRRARRLRNLAREIALERGWPSSELNQRNRASAAGRRLDGGATHARPLAEHGACRAAWSRPSGKIRGTRPS